MQKYNINNTFSIGISYTKPNAGNFGQFPQKRQKNAETYSSEKWRRNPIAPRRGEGTISFKAEGGSVVVYVDCGAEWTAENSGAGVFGCDVQETCITVTADQNLVEEELYGTITVDVNGTEVDREGTITFTAGDGAGNTIVNGTIRGGHALNIHNASYEDGSAMIYCYGGAYYRFDPSAPGTDDADSYRPDFGQHNKNTASLGAVFFIQSSSR